MPGLVALFVTTACGKKGGASEEAQIKLAFESCQKAMIDRQAGQAVSFFPRDVYDYVNSLNSSVGISAPAAARAVSVDSPGVDLLLRTALERKVPAEMRTNLTLDTLMQRIADRNLLNPRDVEAIHLGHVSVNGSRANAEIYYQGTLTALHLPFIKEANAWKIDVMAILPYAEVLMRVDRAIKGETEAQQVDQLVNKLPAL